MTAIMPRMGISDFNRLVNAYRKGARRSIHTYARKYHNADVNHWLAMNEVG
jgi:hypothetical protein